MVFSIKTLFIPCGGTALLILLYIWLAWYVLRASESANASNNNTNNESSKGGHGLSKDDIQKLPTFICNCHHLQKDKDNDGDSIAIPKEEEEKNDELCIDEDLECCVCLEEFKDGERCLVMPTCRHCFHVVCADAWLSKRPICPLCRAAVLPKDDEQCPILDTTSVIDIPSED